MSVCWVSLITKSGCVFKFRSQNLLELSGSRFLIQSTFGSQGKKQVSVGKVGFVSLMNTDWATVTRDVTNSFPGIRTTPSSGLTRGIPGVRNSSDSPSYSFSSPPKHLDPHAKTEQPHQLKRGLHHSIYENLKHFLRSYGC